MPRILFMKLSLSFSILTFSTISQSSPVLSSFRLSSMFICSFSNREFSYQTKLYYVTFIYKFLLSIRRYYFSSSISLSIVCTHTSVVKVSERMFFPRFTEKKERERQKKKWKDVEWISAVGLGISIQSTNSHFCIVYPFSCCCCFFMYDSVFFLGVQCLFTQLRLRNYNPSHLAVGNFCSHFTPRFDLGVGRVNHRL